MTTNRDTNPLDGALNNALRRQDAPPGFSERVLARLAQQEPIPLQSIRKPWLRMFTQPLARWAAFAAIAASLIVGAVNYRNVQRERAEGEAAKQRLMLALRIAGSKLQLVKAKVNEINEVPSETQPEVKRPRSRS